MEAGGSFMSLAWFFPARKISFPRIGQLLTPSQDNYWVAQSPPRFKLWKSFSSCQFKRYKFSDMSREICRYLAICFYRTRSLLAIRACDLTRQDEPVLCFFSPHWSIWGVCDELMKSTFSFGIVQMNRLSCSINYSTGCPNFKLLPFREIQYHVCALNQVI